jgi:hypothetical protein
MNVAELGKIKIFETVIYRYERFKKWKSVKHNVKCIIINKHLYLYAKSYFMKKIFYMSNEKI